MDVNYDRYQQLAFEKIQKYGKRAKITNPQETKNISVNIVKSQFQRTSIDDTVIQQDEGEQYLAATAKEINTGDILVLDEENKVTIKEVNTIKPANTTILQRLTVGS